MPPTARQYARLGPDEFGEADLLSLALADRDLASVLLDEFGSAGGIVAAGPSSLARVLGAGRAARLHATIALAQRGWSEPPRRAFVGTASAAVAWLLPRFAGLRHEELHGLVLNRRLEVVAVRRLSQGTTDQTLFDVRLILGEVLRAGGHGIVLAHNHPSGEVEPSDTDLLVTRRLVEGATLLGITVVDHLVVSGVEWVSLAERGHLPTVRALTPSPIA